MLVSDDDTAGHGALLATTAAMADAGGHTFIPDLPLKGAGLDVTDMDLIQREDLSQRFWICGSVSWATASRMRRSGRSRPSTSRQTKAVILEMYFWEPHCQPDRFGFEKDKSMLRGKRITGHPAASADCPAPVMPAGISQ